MPKAGGLEPGELHRNGTGLLKIGIPVENVILGGGGYFHFPTSVFLRGTTDQSMVLYRNADKGMNKHDPGGKAPMVSCCLHPRIPNPNA